MQGSIAGSEGNVWLSAESIHNHQRGSLSIMEELRETTCSVSLCLFLPLMARVSDGNAHVKALGTETKADVETQQD